MTGSSDSSLSASGSSVVSAAAETHAGIRHFALAVVCLLAASAVSYALPTLDQFRPWVAGERAPVVRMFLRGQDRIELPGFAEAGLVGTSASREELGRTLGSAVAATLDEPEAAVSLSAVEPSPRPVPAKDPDDALPAVRIDPGEYAGITQEIELPHFLERFFSKLERTAQRREAAITRVAHYGDSSVAADAITRTARRRLQTRFGDSGHGFILISRGDMHYGHHDIRHRSSGGWNMLSLVRDQLRHGYYGYGGVQARAKAGEYASFETSKDGAIGKRVSRFELYFQRHKRGNKVRIYVDGRRRHAIDTRHSERQDDYFFLEVSDGPHSFKLRTSGGGYAHLYGVVLERDGPGVVYDSLGLVGARAERLLNADASHMAAQLAHRDPDLLVLGFGGNEAGNRWLQMDRYARELTKVVKTMREGNPGMDCLLFGPLDQGRRNKRGRIITIESLPRIVDVQREVAEAQGCAFFNAYQAMGGKNSIRRWYKSRPQLAGSDLRHATPKGYEVIGKLYYKALLKGFAEFLARR
ncbi:MAG: GDSL-type esterase/lipase family protein [Myxococcales bacterium]|nr:GDSL-type esterase/lipase family protein [Myxococcales bacterium]MDD9965563.1 GDSL-type esterase/lipase family protein [Myxococcales bacterium]